MLGFSNIPFWNCHMKWTLKICSIPLRHFFSNPAMGHCEHFIVEADFLMKNGLGLICNRDWKSIFGKSISRLTCLYFNYSKPSLNLFFYVNLFYYVIFTNPLFNSNLHLYQCENKLSRRRRWQNSLYPIQIHKSIFVTTLSSTHC